MSHTEIRTRAIGIGAQALYLAEITAAGKRHILRDNLGTVTAVKEGWELAIPGRATVVYPSRDDVLEEAKNVFRELN